MKKVLAFAGSNHANSINYQLLEFTSSLVSKAEVTVLDIRAWNIPMYSIDMDATNETPEQIAELINLIGSHDGFIIASPEHNGNTPAFLKNIFDWLSRRAKKVFNDKPTLLLSTSPGGGGAANNLKLLANSLPFQGASIAATFSLPAFQNNFKDGKVVSEHLGQLQESVKEFEEAFG